MNQYFNLWAVLLSAVAGMVVGYVWYGPLFGKKYMTAMGMDAWSPEKKAAMRQSMVKQFSMQFIAFLVMFWVLASNIAWNGLNAGTGAVFAFFMWLGFILPVEYGATLWGRDKTVAWLSIWSNLITLVIAGAIIGAMN